MDIPAVHVRVFPMMNVNTPVPERKQARMVSE